MKKYLLSEADRKAIADLMSRERSAPPRPLIADTRVRPQWQEGDSYWVLPPCETGLPAAEIIGDKLVTVGVECCLYRHSWQLDELEPILDSHSNPIRITVFNYYTRQENGLVQVYKHKDGTWTNERPERPTFGTTTEIPLVTGVGFARQDVRCQGECRWEADADGVWQAPTGGCADATTTTTTTGAPTHPGTTSRPAPLPTTPSPCVDRVCVLVCTDTSTTPAPVDGVAVPYNRFRYTLADGSSCPSGCTCYGLGDPCYLVEGEINSFCSGIATTVPPTTTLSPDSDTCVQAEFLFGPTPDFYYRTAIRNNGGLNDWEVCATCAPGSEPLYPLRGAPYRTHDYPSLATVYESPCVQSPCSEIPSILDEGATFVAYPYEVQVRKWGYLTGATFIDNAANPVKFLANWFRCKNCTGNSRPLNAPPVWIYDSPSLNAQNGVFYDAASNTYRFNSVCEQGFSCDTCGRAPLRKTFPFQGPGTVAPTTTTTIAPCGCIRPDFCPVPYECVRTPCVSGGEVVNGTFGTTQSPSVPCFPDSTTTPGPTTTSTTTPGPNQCIDSYGTLCNCGTTSTTATPTGGTCPPGYVVEYSAFACTVNCRPIGTTTLDTTYPPACVGYCRWAAFRPLNDDGTLSNDLAWQLTYAGCPSVESGGYLDTLGGRCACENPLTFNISPNLCGEFVSTPCDIVSPPTTTTGPTTTLPPCACCSTTTPNPCDVRRCRYRSNSVRQWILVANNCPSNCPCPNPGGLARPASTCESFELPCGFVLPPPTTVPPTTTAGPTTSTTSTTTANPVGCCQQTYSSPSGSYRNCRSATQASCVGGGGIWFGPGQSCVAINNFESVCQVTSTTTTGTTTTGTTTTSGPTTTLDPCAGPCPVTNCGCASGGTIQCPGGAVFNCETCICEEPIGDCCTETFGPPSIFWCFSGIARSQCRNLRGTFFDAGTCAVGVNCGPTTTTTANPMGRCCVGSTCYHNTEDECSVLLGVWTLGGDCSGMNPCGAPPPP